jgi:hypothetical protein
MDFNDKELGSYIMSRSTRVRDCQIWTGAMTQRGNEIGGGAGNGSGYPMAKWRGKVTKMNRAVLADKLGIDIEALPSEIIAAPACTNHACLNPDHIVPSKMVLVPLTEREIVEYFK